MKVLITIGHYSYLLPNDQGVANLAKVLTKAVRADWDYKVGERVITVHGEAPKVEVHYLNAQSKIIHKSARRKTSEGN